MPFDPTKSAQNVEELKFLGKRILYAIGIGVAVINAVYYTKQAVGQEELRQMKKNLNKMKDLSSDAFTKFTE